MNELILSGLLAASGPQPYVIKHVDPNYEQRALRFLGRAMYKEYDLDEYTRRLRKRYVNKDVEKYAGYIGICTKIVIEKRIEFRLEF